MVKKKKLEDIKGPAIIVGCVIGSKEYIPANKRFNDFVNKDLTKYNMRRLNESKKYNSETA